MSAHKHTPGPWVFGKTSEDRRLILGGPSRRYVATVTIHQIPRHMGLWEENEREANARLIAAAPDLLAALEGTLAKWVDMANSGDCGFWDPEEEQHVIAARAAIAKATGAA